MQLNTVEDNRWEIFQQGARRRRRIAIGATLSFAIICIFTQSILPILIGEALLLLAFKYWIYTKNKK